MFDFFGRGGKSMMDAVQEAQSGKGARMVDVRSPEEFRGGHVPGAINLPLDNLQAAGRLLNDKSAKLYLYCASGARSSMAAGMLKRMGYVNCENVGGIGAYKGKLEF
ncbi:MAG TPA: rhodanese-like domain-containing protein [Clostridia bacterium]|mgnify:FL=1|nr:rhodanese-like domain-containing protein [Clostridia bacterium]